MDQANTLDADAIVHAGDIFDHAAIGADRSFVIDALNSELNIPFYYIYGNHDEPASRRTVDGATNDTSEIERLLKNGESVGETDVTLFGIDYSHDSFPGRTARSPRFNQYFQTRMYWSSTIPIPPSGMKTGTTYIKRGEQIFGRLLNKPPLKLILSSPDTCTSVNRARLMSSKRPSLLPAHQHQSIVGKKTTTRQRGSSV